MARRRRALQHSRKLREGLSGIVSVLNDCQDLSKHAKRPQTSVWCGLGHVVDWGYEARDDKSLVACFARRYGDCRTIFRICAAALAHSRSADLHRGAVAAADAARARPRSAGRAPRCTVQPRAVTGAAADATAAAADIVSAGP